MAMQATHVKFALDIMDLLGVEDQREYLAGTMYPDSRYISKIDRKKTHDYSVDFHDLLTGSDFEKGWKVHVIYDKMQSVELRLLFNITGPTPMMSNGWLQVSAAKFFENMHICEVLGDDLRLLIDDHLHHCPNGECESAIIEWYKVNDAVYEQGGSKLEHYKPIFDYYKDSAPEISEGILREYYRQKEDAELIATILKIYDKVLKKTYEGLKS